MKGGTVGMPAQRGIRLARATAHAGVDTHTGSFIGSGASQASNASCLARRQTGAQAYSRWIVTSGMRNRGFLPAAPGHEVCQIAVAATADTRRRTPVRAAHRRHTAAHPWPADGVSRVAPCEDTELASKRTPRVLASATCVRLIGGREASAGHAVAPDQRPGSPGRRYRGMDRSQPET